jgi:hypothetical protein
MKPVFARHTTLQELPVEMARPERDFYHGKSHLLLGNLVATRKEPEDYIARLSGLVDADDQLPAGERQHLDRVARGE